MPSTHAILGPSSAARWTSCPASVRLSEGVERSDTAYSRQGTAVHELCELKAGALRGPGHAASPDEIRAWHERNADLFTDDERIEADFNAERYTNFLRGLMDDHDWAMLFLEQRVQTGIPGCWGTSDAVIITPGRLEIVDYKNGAGVPVSAVENPQLMLYGVGALETIADLLCDVETVGMSIFQPRVGDGEPSRWELPAEELRAWRDSLLPVAAEALAGSARFGPSEKACQWCPVAATCRARVEAVDLSGFDDDPEQLTPEEIADALRRIPGFRAWAAKLESHALDLATDGPGVPGFKAVLSGGRRAITDPDAAIAALVADGVPLEDVTETTTKVCPLGHLEKTLGRERVASTIGGYIVKGAGKPSLVPEDDRREPLGSSLDGFDIEP